MPFNGEIQGRIRVRIRKTKVWTTCHRGGGRNDPNGLCIAGKWGNLPVFMWPLMGLRIMQYEVPWATLHARNEMSHPRGQAWGFGRYPELRWGATPALIPFIQRNELHARYCIVIGFRKQNLTVQQL